MTTDNPNAFDNDGNPITLSVSNGTSVKAHLKYLITFLKQRKTDMNEENLKKLDFLLKTLETKLGKLNFVLKEVCERLKK